jgi:hypothetical protein
LSDGLFSCKERSSNDHRLPDQGIARGDGIVLSNLNLYAILNYLQASDMRKLGLNAKAINSDTIETTKREEGEDLWVTSRIDTNVILAGPEQLKSASFEYALHDKTWWMSKGTDEVK